MSLDPAQLERLIVEAQEGDKEAFAGIYNHFFDPIYRYVYFRVNPEEVDDLVEDVFVKAWVNLPKYQKREAGFNSWIYKIASNSVIDHRRTHRSIATLDPEMQDHSVEASPEERAHQSLMGRDVRQALSKIREPYRQLLTLKFLNGFSNEEIAKTLDRSEGNIRLLQYRALKALRAQLEKSGFLETKRD